MRELLKGGKREVRSEYVGVSGRMKWHEERSRIGGRGDPRSKTKQTPI
jgi:hypothetical protein